jgi:hypothetical protein
VSERRVKEAMVRTIEIGGGQLLDSWFAKACDSDKYGRTVLWSGVVIE